MTGMSEREHATHSGLSRGRLQRARKNGRLVVHDDASINAAALDAPGGKSQTPTGKTAS
jgi:hypothetical protein